MTPSNIDYWRRRIDELDRKLVELLNERSRCALEIGRLKRTAQLPLYQPDREREVLENAERANSGPLSGRAIRRLFERILDEARSVEREAMHAEESATEVSQETSKPPRTDRG
jgi:chorismate mutase-like protein